MLIVCLSGVGMLCVQQLIQTVDSYSSVDMQPGTGMDDVSRSLGLLRIYMLHGGQQAQLFILALMLSIIGLLPAVPGSLFESDNVCTSALQHSSTLPSRS